MKHVIVVEITGKTDLNKIAKAIDYTLASDDIKLPDWVIWVDGETWNEDEV